MKVIESLKLNKFEVVSIPRNSSLFSRFGNRPAPKFQDGQVSELGQDKLDILSSAMSNLDEEVKIISEKRKKQPNKV